MMDEPTTQVNFTREEALIAATGIEGGETTEDGKIYLNRLWERLMLFAESGKRNRLKRGKYRPRKKKENEYEEL